MIRSSLFAFATVATSAIAIANPMNDKIPFSMEQGLSCSALLVEAAKASQPTKPFGPDEAHEAAFWGYAMGAAVLAKRAGKGPKFADHQVAQRGPAVRAMPPTARKAATDKCVADFARYQGAAKKRDR